MKSKKNLFAAVLSLLLIFTFVPVGAAFAAEAEAETATFTITFVPGYLGYGDEYQLSGLTYGQQYKLPEPEDCGIYSGHPFAYWRADDGSSYMIEEEIIITRDITLAAVFER